MPTTVRPLKEKVTSLGLLEGSQVNVPLTVWPGLGPLVQVNRDHPGGAAPSLIGARRRRGAHDQRPTLKMRSSRIRKSVKSVPVQMLARSKPPNHSHLWSSAPRARGTTSVASTSARQTHANARTRRTFQTGMRISFKRERAGTRAVRDERRE